jgi:hypothetical protein
VIKLFFWNVVRRWRERQGKIRWQDEPVVNHKVVIMSQWVKRKEDQRAGTTDTKG